MWGDIVTPSASKVSVWTYFGYMKDLTTGRAAVGKKAMCKLCLLEVAHSGGTNDVVTCWNSTLDVASRLCEQQAAIAAVLHGKHDLHHLELSPQEWHILEDLIKLLEPFRNATEDLSGQKYPTLSCLGPALADLKEKLVRIPITGYDKEDNIHSTNIQHLSWLL